MSAALSNTPSSSQQQVDYLNLMITQLRNQNPLDPMDNGQMATQLAQLSQLQQTEEMASTFKQVLLTTQMNYAQSLIGKQVSFVPAGGDTVTTALVTAAGQTDGEVQLRAGSSILALKDIISISR